MWGRASVLGNADDLEGQITVCKELIARYFPGVEIANVPVIAETNNLEKYDAKDRVWELVDLIERGVYDVIVMKNLNRLWRSTTPEGQQVKARIESALRKARVKVITTDGELLLTPIKTFVDTVRLELGPEQKRVLSRSIQDGIRAALINGTFIPPIAPYGYKVEKRHERSGEGWTKVHGWVVVDHEGKVVQDVFNVANGLPTSHLAPFPPVRVSPRSIAAWLNEQAEQASRKAYVDRRRSSKVGLLWTESTVRALLRRRSYTGIHTCSYGSESTPYWDETVTTDIDVPALISQQLFDGAQKVAAAREQTRRKGEPGWAPLHLKLRCRCGEGMAFEGRSVYRCNSRRYAGNSDHDQINSRLADHVVMTTLASPAFVADVIAAMEAMPLASRDSRKEAQLQGRLADLNRKIERLTDLELDAVPSQLPLLKEKSRTTHEEIVAVQRELRSITAGSDDRGRQIEGYVATLRRLSPDSDALSEYVAQFVIDQITVKAATPAATSEKGDAVMKYCLGILNAEDAGAILGIAGTSVTVRHSKRRHPIAKGLWTTAFSFTVRLATGQELEISAEDVLRRTYDKLQK
jgi:hypothetical protein